MNATIKIETFFSTLKSDATLLYATEIKRHPGRQVRTLDRKVTALVRRMHEYTLTRAMLNSYWMDPAFLEVYYSHLR